MRKFKTSEEAEKFFIDFMRSEFWQMMEEMIKQRTESILASLGDAKTSSDGRAMLTGRLLELNYLKKSPQNFLNFFQTQKDMFKVEASEKETLISKPSFPDIITH